MKSSGNRESRCRPCRKRTSTTPISPTALPQKPTARSNCAPRDRQRKLISKIDAALQRIEDNTYGYCEETGEPISLKRLEARPIATLSVEAQERHEKREKVYRDE